MNNRIVVSTVFFVLLAVGAAIVAKPDAVSVFQSVAGKDGRKLPIYCVETDEKKVAVTFDAAWVESQLG